MIRIIQLNENGETDQTFDVSKKKPEDIFWNIKKLNAVIITDTERGALWQGIGIALEDDIAGLNIIKERNLPVLTCGFSPTCSVTISGKNDKGAVICFQREIKLAEETVIEAGERVMPRKGCNDDCVLMLRAALGILLFGDSFFDSFV